MELDTARAAVMYQGKRVELSKNELKILHCLFEHKNEIVSRMDLVEYLWDQQVFIDDNALSVNMTRLRARLEEIGIHNFIETKRGMEDYVDMALYYARSDAVYKDYMIKETNL